MTTESLIALLQLVTALTLLFGLIFVILSVSYFRRSRRDAFWRQRRTAGQRGFRYAVGAVLMLGIASAFCMITLAVTFVEGDKDDDLASAPSPTLTASPSLTPTFGETTTIAPLSTATATISATNTMSAAESSIAEAAIANVPTLIPTILTPTPQSTEIVTASRIEIWAIDNRITDDWQPVAPQITFTGQIQRLYFYVNFQDIEAGETVKKSLLRDGEVVSQQIHTWGMTATQGATFFFFGNASGFLPGNYEMRVTLGAEDILLSTAAFTITQ